MAANSGFSRRIRVVFFALYFEAWDSLSGIYNAMLADPRFEPIVVTLPRKLTGAVAYGDEELAHDFLVANSVEHIRLNGDDFKESQQKLKQLVPDYVFLNYPWQRNYPPAFRPDELVKFTRILYTPYFLTPLVKEGVHDIAPHIYTQRTHQLASLIFCQDEATVNALESFSRGNAYVRNVGSAKLDSLRSRYEQVLEHSDADVRKILWAPHHSYSPAWLNFGTFADTCEEMLALAIKRKDLEFTLRPHPFLFGTLVDRNVMTDDQLKAWMLAWEAQANTSIDAATPFADQFASHHILVSDGISFIAEWPLLTGKAAVFIEKPGHWEFNKIGTLAAATAVTVSEVKQFAELLSVGTQADNTNHSIDYKDLAKQITSGKRLEALTALRSAVDPNPGQVAARILNAVANDFTTGSPLIMPENIPEIPWEDQPGREPRTD